MLVAMDTEILAWNIIRKETGKSVGWGGGWGLKGSFSGRGVNWIALYTHTHSPWKTESFELHLDFYIRSERIA